MKNIKLIMFDIDGTLVDDNRKLTSNTLKTLTKLKDNNIMLGLASGRPIDEIETIVEDWDFKDFDLYIGMNGSQLDDKLLNRQDSFYLLKREWMKSIIEYLITYDLNPYICSNDGVLLARRYDELIQISSEHTKKEIVVANDINDICEEENAKILVRINKSEIDKILEDFNSLGIKEYKAFKTQSNLLEFANSLNSKANTLKVFCDHHNLSLNNVISFGDTSNDNELIKESGIGVAMINGSDDTKMIADDISEYSNNEDGVSKYLIKYFKY